MRWPPASRSQAGEKVKDYPQLSIRVPLEFKARLNALSAVTGLAQWRVIVQAINCFEIAADDGTCVQGLSADAACSVTGSSVLRQTRCGAAQNVMLPELRFDRNISVNNCQGALVALT